MIASKSLVRLLACMCVCLSVSRLGAEDFRMWDDIIGRSFEARLVSVQSRAVTLENRDGKRIDFPIADLKPQHIEYVREWQISKVQAGDPGSDPVKPMTPLLEAIEGNTVVFSSNLRSGDFNRNAEYYAFYFSAHWCPPCRKFTPELSAFYKKHFEPNGKFEVIFVSSDRDEDAMEEYMDWGKMKFPALDFDKKDKISEVTRYAGNGIPCLVLVDRDGNVVANSYVNGRYVGPTSVLEKLESVIQ